jgi:hypothetical protein
MLVLLRPDILLITFVSEAELHVRSVVSWIYDESAAAQAMPGRAEDPFVAPMAARSSPVCLRVWSGPIPRRST